MRPRRTGRYFYKEVTQVYGLRPDSIDYDQFSIDADGKTLYWTPGDKKILIPTTRGGVRFLALPTMASRYGVGGTDALGRSLGLTGYTLGTSRVVPGLCPIAAFEPAIWISLLYPWTFPGWSAMSLGIR